MGARDDFENLFGGGTGQLTREQEDELDVREEEVEEDLEVQELETVEQEVEQEPPAPVVPKEEVLHSSVLDSFIGECNEVGPDGHLHQVQQVRTDFQ